MAARVAAAHCPTAMAMKRTSSAPSRPPGSMDGSAERLEQAYALWQTPLYEGLHQAITEALVEHGTLDRSALDRIKSGVTEGSEMERLELTAKAVTTDTDAGTFSAVVGSQTVDRERDIVEPSAMVTALLRAWTGTGKRVPLTWHHSTAPEDVIGRVNPGSAKAVDGEVVVDGWIDQSTERGQHAWRLAKARVLGFSFGFLITESTNRASRERHITGVDIFETTATITPANGDTRVLDWKALEVDADPEVDPEYRGIFEEWRDLLTTALDADPGDGETVEAKAARTAHEYAHVRPVKISPLWVRRSLMDELRDLVETAHRDYVVAACLWRDPAWRRRDLDELAEVGGRE